MIEKIAEMYPQAADLKLQITNKIRLRNCGIAVADQVFPPRGGIAIADLKKSSASHLCFSEDSQVQFRSSYWLIHFSGLHTTVLKVTGNHFLLVKSVFVKIKERVQLIGKRD